MLPLMHYRTLFCRQYSGQRYPWSFLILHRLAEKYLLGSMAYYYNGIHNAGNEEAISSIILGNLLLTANGVPVAGEYDIKNAKAMKNYGFV